LQNLPHFAIFAVANSNILVFRQATERNLWSADAGCVWWTAESDSAADRRYQIDDPEGASFRVNAGVNWTWEGT